MLLFSLGSRAKLSGCLSFLLVPSFPCSALLLHLSFVFSLSLSLGMSLSLSLLLFLLFFFCFSSFEPPAAPERKKNKSTATKRMLYFSMASTSRVMQYVLEVVLHHHKFLTHVTQDWSDPARQPGITCMAHLFSGPFEALEACGI